MLARIRKAQENNEGGFTLIELLVVMIIIGILAAIAIPAFLSQKTKGYEASVKSDLRSVATEVSTQLIDEPTTLAITSATGSVTVGEGSINLTPGNTVTGSVVTTAGSTYGDYCITGVSSKGGAAWKISQAGEGSQVLAKGNCG
jgi:type IV pilus assembly protein PilA